MESSQGAEADSKDDGSLVVSDAEDVEPGFPTSPGFPSVDEIADAVDLRTVGTVDAALSATERRLSAVLSVQGNDEMDLKQTSAEALFEYLPEGAAEYASGYFTPFLWGIAAGFVAYLIGLAWESMVRFFGLVRAR